MREYTDAMEEEELKRLEETRRKKKEKKKEHIEAYHARGFYSGLHYRTETISLLTCIALTFRVVKLLGTRGEAPRFIPQERLSRARFTVERVRSKQPVAKQCSSFRGSPSETDCERSHSRRRRRNRVRIIKTCPTDGENFFRLWRKLFTRRYIRRWKKSKDPLQAALCEQQHTLCLSVYLSALLPSLSLFFFTLSFPVSLLLFFFLSLSVSLSLSFS